MPECWGLYQEQLSHLAFPLAGLSGGWDAEPSAQLQTPLPTVLPRGKTGRGAQALWVLPRARSPSDISLGAPSCEGSSRAAEAQPVP